MNKDPKSYHLCTDDELVALAKAGDKLAFDELVKAYEQKVTNLIKRYFQNPQEISDITQEVFLKVYLALDSFRGESAFFTWVYRVAINTAKNYLILKGRRPQSVDLDFDSMEKLLGRTFLKEYSTPENLLLCDELNVKIFDIIEGLSDELQLAFVLREVEGFSYEDIADILECPIGTVRSRIFRARECIEEAIRKMLEK